MTRRAAQVRWYEVCIRALFLLTCMLQACCSASYGMALRTLHPSLQMKDAAALAFLPQCCWTAYHCPPSTTPTCTARCAFARRYLSKPSDVLYAVRYAAC